MNLIESLNRHGRRFLLREVVGRRKEKKVKITPLGSNKGFKISAPNIYITGKQLRRAEEKARRIEEWNKPKNKFGMLPPKERGFIGQPSLRLRKHLGENPQASSDGTILYCDIPDTAQQGVHYFKEYKKLSRGGYITMVAVPQISNPSKIRFFYTIGQVGNPLPTNVQPPGLKFESTAQWFEGRESFISAIHNHFSEVNEFFGSDRVPNEYVNEVCRDVHETIRDFQVNVYAAQGLISAKDKQFNRINLETELSNDAKKLQYLYRLLSGNASTKDFIRLDRDINVPSIEVYRLYYGSELPFYINDPSQALSDIFGSKELRALPRRNEEGLSRDSINAAADQQQKECLAALRDAVQSDAFQLAIVKDDFGNPINIGARIFDPGVHKLIPELDEYLQKLCAAEAKRQYLNPMEQRLAAQQMYDNEVDFLKKLYLQQCKSYDVRHCGILWLDFFERDLPDLIKVNKGYEPSRPRLFPSFIAVINKQFESFNRIKIPQTKEVINWLQKYFSIKHESAKLVVQKAWETFASLRIETPEDRKRRLENLPVVTKDFIERYKKIAQAYNQQDWEKKTWYELTLRAKRGGIKIWLIPPVRFDVVDLVDSLKEQYKNIGEFSAPISVKLNEDRISYYYAMQRNGAIIEIAHNLTTPEKEGQKPTVVSSNVEEVYKAAKKYVDNPLENKNLSTEYLFDKSYIADKEAEFDVRERQRRAELDDFNKTKKDIEQFLTSRGKGVGYEETKAKMRSIFMKIYKSSNDIALAQALNKLGEFVVKDPLTGESGTYVFGPTGQLFKVVGTKIGGKKAVEPVVATPFDSDSTYMKVLKAIRDTVMRRPGEYPTSDLYIRRADFLDVYRLRGDPEGRAHAEAFVNWANDLFLRINEFSTIPIINNLKSAMLLSSLRNYYDTGINHAAASPNVIVTNIPEASLGVIPEKYFVDSELIKRLNSRVKEQYFALSSYLHDYFAKQVLNNKNFFDNYGISDEMKKKMEDELTRNIEVNLSTIQSLANEVSDILPELYNQWGKGKKFQDLTNEISKFYNEPTEPSIIDRLLNRFSSAIEEAWHKFIDVVAFTFDAFTNIDKIFSNLAIAFEDAVTTSVKMFFNIFFNNFIDTHFSSTRLTWVRQLCRNAMELMGFYVFKDTDRELLQRVGLGSDYVETPITRQKVNMLNYHLNLTVPRRALWRNERLLNDAYQAFGDPVFEVPSAIRGRRPEFYVTYHIVDEEKARKFGFYPEVFSADSEALDRWWLHGPEKSIEGTRVTGYDLLFPKITRATADEDLLATSRMAQKYINTPARYFIRLSNDGRSIRIKMSLDDLGVRVDEVYKKEFFRKGSKRNFFTTQPLRYPDISAAQQQEEQRQDDLSSFDNMVPKF